MSKYLDKAKEIRAIVEPHHNCAQSVLMSFNNDIGIPDELAFKVGSHFGGGMKTGSVCGVITGALMTLGLYGLDSPELTQQVFKFFKEQHNDILMCAELLKINAANGGQRKPHCDALVYEMVTYVEKILRENGKIE